MYVALVLAITLTVVAGQFGFRPYRAFNPYAFQPYAQSYNNYYRAPAPRPSPFSFTPPQPVVSPYKQASNDLGTLPFLMYDNFVCNKIAGRTRKRRDTNFGAFMQSPGQKAYQQLFSFVDSSEHQQIWDQTHYLERQGYSAEKIVKQITAQRMYNDGENGNINDIYNAMNFLSSSPRALIQETQKRDGSAVCSTINSFYCSYINKLQAQAQYCSSAILSNQLYQQCCQFVGTTSTQVPSPIPLPVPSPIPLPVPLPVPSPLSSPIASFPQTAFSTNPTSPAVPTVSTAPGSRCGISTKNPATRMGEFSTSMNQMRIVGGVNAERCEYPWMVRLQIGNSMCGGSVIDNTHILTAAHCVGSANPTINVYAGEYDYNNMYESNDQRKTAVNVVRHPNYRNLPNGEQENDIAIIKLNSPLQFNECVQPICLAENGDAQNLPPGTQCVTAGWGTTSLGGQASPILQETTIPTYTGEDCSKYFSKTVPSNPNTQLCAGRPIVGGIDTCQGDSGGPLFCPIEGRYVQYGVVSYGAGCAAAGAAGVYTDVGSMSSFINSVIRN